MGHRLVEHVAHVHGVMLASRPGGLCVCFGRSSSSRMYGRMYGPNSGMKQPCDIICSKHNQPRLPCNDWRLSTNIRRWRRSSHRLLTSTAWLFHVPAVYMSRQRVSTGKSARNSGVTTWWMPTSMQPIFPMRSCRYSRTMTRQSRRKRHA